MNPVMYIFINKGLGMSTGKIAAQASHAAVQAYKLSKQSNPAITAAWEYGGQYPKIILEVPSTDKLQAVERYLNDRGFKTAMIVDEGRTEIPEFSITALGVEIVDKDKELVAKVFQFFRLYRDDPKPSLIDRFLGRI